MREVYIFGRPSNKIDALLRYIIYDSCQTMEAIDIHAWIAAPCELHDWETHF